MIDPFPKKEEIPKKYKVSSDLECNPTNMYKTNTPNICQSASIDKSVLIKYNLDPIGDMIVTRHHL